MLAQPTRKGFSASARGQISRPMRGEIHQDRPISVTAPKRKIISPQEARRADGSDWCRSLCSSQERTSTHCSAHLLHQAFTRLCAEGKRDAIQDHPETSRSPSLNWDHFWYPFHEGLLATLPIRASKTANAQD
jgi:hypothetical protein